MRSVGIEEVKKGIYNFGREDIVLQPKIQHPNYFALKIKLHPDIEPIAPLLIGLYTNFKL